jgi:hypothetical protein
MGPGGCREQLPSTIAVDVPGLGTDGFLNATAADLNAIPEDQTLPGISVRYVTAGQLSTGQFVVSVNPISPTLWAAVALGPDGRCYGALASDPDYSNTTWNEYFARFPAGTPCRGSIATAATVTDNYQPG